LKGLLKSFWWSFRSSKTARYFQSYGPNEVCDILNVRRKMLQYRIISKDRRFRGKVVLIPRIRLSSNTDTLSMPLKRLQFPVRLAFAMTINKSQGQSVEHVGINL